MKCLDYYLSGIARAAWPRANVFYTQLSPPAPTDRAPPSRIWERYPPEMRTRYRVVLELRENEAEAIGLGDTFKEAKANLRRLVADEEERRATIPLSR